MARASGVEPGPLAAAVVAWASDQPESKEGGFKLIGLPTTSGSDTEARITIRLTTDDAIAPGEFEVVRVPKAQAATGAVHAQGNVEIINPATPASAFDVIIRSSGDYEVTRVGQVPKAERTLKFELPPSVLSRKPRIVGLIDEVTESSKVRYLTRIGAGSRAFRNNPAGSLSARVVDHQGRSVVVVDSDGNVLGQAEGNGNPQDPLDVALTLRGTGARRLFAADAWALTTGDGDGVEVVYQDPSDAAGAVAIRAMSTNRFLEPTPAPTSVPISATVVDGFLRLVGETGTSTSLRFAVFEPTANDRLLFVRRERDAERSDFRSRGAGSWDVVLDLVDRQSSTPPPETYRVLAVDERSAAGHGFSRAVEVTSAGAIDLPVPTIDKVRPTGGVTEGSGGTAETDGYRTNERRLTIEGGGVPESEFNAGAVVAVFHEGQPEPIAVYAAPEHQGDTWSQALRELADGEYTLRAYLVRGDTRSKPSAPYRLGINRTGPVIEEYVPFDFGVGTGSQTLTVRLTGNPLNADEVADLNNYEFHRDEGGTLEYAADARSALVSAEYERPTNSIHLRFNNLPASNYRITLKSTATELRDVYGNQIREFPDDPERRLIRKFERTASGGARGRLAALETATIPEGRKGPFVPYPEFVEPRQPTNGFNPADKVETRVVRLYYNRDAHRVAQIVNRHVESYNRVAVDTRRRLATETRREADDLTDSRRVGELRAIRAAELARAAERELQQAIQAQGDLEGSRENALDQEPVLRRRISEAEAAIQDPTTDAADRTRLEERLAADRARLDRVERDRAAGDDGLTAARDRVLAARQQVDSAREEEAAARLESARETFAEDRAREQQFRLEVAAAHEDPDTYAPGRPSSIDPVEQVSVSVVGEAMIQLRGPMKGVNIVRKMINELDGPAGQVRIAIHTVQINGEHGDRMEKVAGRIKDYIDHSRFLTMQSGQYLRNAVVRVASRRAAEAAAECPDERTQDARDHKYIASFFGEDFLRELMKMDSEFLRTGNKVLSIHSMDSTSLASALFLMSLAKNETRMEILDEFRMMLESDLPAAELNYYQAGGERDAGKKHAHAHGHKKRDDFVMLAHNARFQSLIGYFEHQVDGNDTLNPIQREFIRLAQIFKSRLVTEMQYNQRVRERAIIEERLGNRIQELTKQRERREAAEKALEEQRQALNQRRAEIFSAFMPLGNEIREAQNKTNQAAEVALKVVGVLDIDAVGVEKITEIRNKVGSNIDTTSRTLNVLEEASRRGMVVTYGDLVGETAISSIRKDLESTEASSNDASEKVRGLNAIAGIATADEPFPLPIDGENRMFIFSSQSAARLLTPVGSLNPTQKKHLLERAQALYQDWVGLVKQIKDLLDKHHHSRSLNHSLQAVDAKYRLVLAVGPEKALSQDDFTNLSGVLEAYVPALQYLQGLNQVFITRFNKLVGSLANADVDVQALYRELQTMRGDLMRIVKGDLATRGGQIFDRIEAAFRPLLETDVRRQFAEDALKEARAAFDHKKLLDMHIDDMEDKYIELLEGTRAHIAVVDGYIKALATALDDDFNTQYYEPAFRKVREASRFWDVQLGQIERTSVLTNNRGFGKVDPTATMEFDLPKRDILITEAMNGAKALMDEYGALLNDPTFLALTKLRSGQPTSSMAQGTLGGGASSVRSVLPELSRNDDEEVLRQAGPGRREFGSALEALIPDPAIYKFETGTGYEVRPVIQPDGQAVTFDFNYMYTTNVREPVRADEKHLGRVKRHFIHTPVQLTNYELREVSTYQVALKASRTSRGVPLLEDVPGVGVLFRPLPNAESSLQENIVLAHGAIFPTLFDLMGLRWAPAVSDLDTLRLKNEDFIVRSRRQDLSNRTYDESSWRVDEFLRTPRAERRTDLYRSQETIPSVHPNGYRGPGLNLRDSHMQEGYDPRALYPPSRHIPGASRVSTGLPTDDLGLPVDEEGRPLGPGYPTGEFGGHEGGPDEAGSTAVPPPSTFDDLPPPLPPETTTGPFAPPRGSSDASRPEASSSLIEGASRNRTPGTSSGGARPEGSSSLIERSPRRRTPGASADGSAPASSSSLGPRDGVPAGSGPAPDLAPPVSSARPATRGTVGAATQWRRPTDASSGPSIPPPRRPTPDPSVQRAAATTSPAAPTSDAPRKGLFSRLRGQ
ncbi:hypothetical protein [Paludisphaera sp.]|uniref:hypothetical protein n=1 Tax=Paludisphaera sp. TaxID=2017432 RepID=UPI00301C62D6